MDLNRCFLEKSDLYNILKFVRTEKELGLAKVTVEYFNVKRNTNEVVAKVPPVSKYVRLNIKHSVSVYLYIFKQLKNICSTNNIYKYNY